MLTQPLPLVTSEGLHYVPPMSTDNKAKSGNAACVPNPRLLQLLTSQAMGHVSSTSNPALVRLHSAMIANTCPRAVAPSK